MRDRMQTGLMLLALLSTAWFAGRWAFAASAAPAGQPDPMRAAIHAGTCAEPGSEPDYALAGFERESGPGAAAGPLSSFSEVPVRLDTLLASPHALLITLGGELAATLACGDIDDLSGGLILGVELVEQADSGVSGLGLILDDGTVTRVSVILDDAVAAPLEPVASPLPQATPIASGPTPTPGDVEPAPTSRAGFPIPLPPVSAETPAAPTVPPDLGEPTPTPAAAGVPPAAATSVISSIPIGLPPIAQGTTPTPPPGPPVAAGDALTAYASEEFGYSVAIPAGWTLLSPPAVRPGFDQIVLTNGQSQVSITVFNNPSIPDATACIDDNYGFMRSLPQTVLIVPHEGPEAGLATRSPELTIELWDMVLLNGDNEHWPITYYNECRSLGPGQGVLLLAHEARQEIYAEQAVERDRLFGGVVMP